MSHFAYTRAAGIWNPGTGLLAAEMASLDAKTFAAINGDAGGTWAPSSLITIGGSGLSVTADFAATANVTLGATSSNFLFVNATTQFEGPVTIGLAHSPTFTVISDTLFENFCGIAATGSFDCAPAAVLHGNVTLGDNNTKSLTVGATSHFNSDATFTGVLGVSGAGASLQCSAPVVIFAGNTLTTAGDIQLSGAGSIIKRTVLGTAANGTYSSSTADVVFLRSSLTAGVFSYTIDHVDAVEGKEIVFAMETGMAAGMEIDLLDIAGGRVTPSGVRLKNAAGNYTSIRCQFISSQWRIAGFSPV